MRKTALTVLAGAAAIGLAGTAQAQDREAPQADITRAEAQQRAAQAFERMDSNRDGRLDAADREARVKARFDRVDADGDGSLTFNEFTAARAPRGERPESARAQAPGNRGERMGRRGMHGAMGLRGVGRNADADGDGAITRAEFESAALAHFDAADTDRNGTLTAAERKAQHDARRDEWRERRGQRTD